MEVKAKISHDCIESIEEQFTKDLKEKYQDKAMNLVLSYDVSVTQDEDKNIDIDFVENSIELTHQNENKRYVFFDFKKLSVIDQHKVRMHCIETMFEKYADIVADFYETNHPSFEKE